MPRGQPSRRALVLMSALVALCSMPARAAEPRPLELGKPIDRDLGVNETHVYSVNASSGQYLQATVDQLGIDVVVTITDPALKKLTEIDGPNGAREPERIALMTESSGLYRVEIRASNQGASGPYRVVLEQLHDATTDDEKRIRAFQAFAEGIRLAGQLTKETFVQGLEQLRSSAPLFHQLSDLEHEADALFQEGTIHSMRSEMSQAIEALNQSLALMRQARVPRGEAAALNGLGEAYFNLGEQRKALEVFNEALPRWRASGYCAGIALTLNNTGLAHDLLGEKQRALEYYQEALPLSRALGDRMGEAFTLSGIGKIQDDINEKQQALDTYRQSLSLIRAAGGDLRGEGAMLNNIGLVYASLGENEESLRYYSESLEFRRKVGDPRGEATTLTAIGKAHLDLGDKDRAREDFTRALSLSQTAKDPRGQAVALTRLGTLEESLGNKRKALDYQTQALELRRSQGDPMLICASLCRVGQLQAEFGELGQAQQSFEEALTLALGLRDPLLEGEALYHLASLKRDQGSLDEARRLVEDAIQRFESLRTKLSSPDLRASYFGVLSDPFGLYADVLMRLHALHPSEGFDARAIEAEEQGRARGLLDLLAEARVRIRQGVDPALLKRERSLRQLLGAKLDRQARLLTAKKTQDQAADAAKEIDSITAEYEQVEAQIRVKSPRYAALTQPQPLTAAEIQRELLDKDTVLLEYALGEERSFLWAVTESGISSYELPARTEIDTAARDVYEEIRLPPGRGVSAAKRESDRTKLSDMVLGPVANTLSRRRLIVVTDGSLQFVPFASLTLPPDVAGAASAPRTPLIEGHEIVSLPSASTLAVLRRDLSGRSPAPKTVAILADPVFERDDARLRRVHLATADRSALSSPATNPEAAGLSQSVRDIGFGEAASGIPRLLFTRREAEAILPLVPASQRKVALDFDASLATATSPELAQYRFLHFATHGFLNSTHPGLSGLVLSLVDRKGHDEPGFLPAYEVFNLNLPADLVVLSACRTALGKQIRGEGLVGLTRAFMYAGAARVVSSLWTVDDAATAELMKRFYEGMLGAEKKNPAAALRAAQTAVRKQSRWEDPYYWAGFVLQGEW